jgi:hypothetical protein
MIQEKTFSSIRAAFEHYDHGECRCGDSSDGVRSYVRFCTKGLGPLPFCLIFSDLHNHRRCFSPIPSLVQAPR